MNSRLKTFIIENLPITLFMVCSITQLWILSNVSHLTASLIYLLSSACYVMGMAKGYILWNKKVKYE